MNPAPHRGARVNPAPRRVDNLEVEKFKMMNFVSVEDIYVNSTPTSRDGMNTKGGAG